MEYIYVNSYFVGPFNNTWNAVKRIISTGHQGGGGDSIDRISFRRRWNPIISQGFRVSERVKMGGMKSTRCGCREEIRSYSIPTNWLTERKHRRHCPRIVEFTYSQYNPKKKAWTEFFCWRILCGFRNLTLFSSPLSLLALPRDVRSLLECTWKAKNKPRKGKPVFFFFSFKIQRSSSYFLFM